MVGTVVSNLPSGWRAANLSPLNLIVLSNNSNQLHSCEPSALTKPHFLLYSIIVYTILNLGVGVLIFLFSAAVQWAFFWVSLTLRLRDDSNDRLTIFSSEHLQTLVKFFCAQCYWNFGFAFVVLLCISLMSCCASIICFSKLSKIRFHSVLLIHYL
jgi:hypothetical protein